MIILILQLPDGATQGALCSFVDKALRRVWLLPVFRKGLLESCEVRRIRDPHTGSEEYQALVYVDDDRTGEALIRHLNARKVDDWKVTARVYHQRAVSSDRRVNLADSHNIAIVDRRRGDRRRPGLIIETLHGPLAPGATH